jgi:hypothetical protein
VTVLGADFISAGVDVGRRVKLPNDSTYYTIRQVTGATSIVLDLVYPQASTSGTYEIYPQEEYALPPQCGHRMFLWHEEYGYPFMMRFTPEQEFYFSGKDIVEKNVPEEYRMWGEDMTLRPVLTPTTFAVFSSDASDTTQTVRLFGDVSSYPDSESIALSGATVVTGSALFSSLERVMKDGSTNGRISITASGDTSIVYAVIPTGDVSSGILYKKIQIHPLPTDVFNINVQYYKEPFALVNDNDVHELGQEFDEAIILLATAKVKAETNQTEAATFYELFKEELSTLRRTNADKIDWYPTMKRPYNSRAGFVGGTMLQYRQAGGLYGPQGY